MSTQTYAYEAHFTWKWTRDYAITAIPSDADYQNKLMSDFKTAFAASLAAKMAPSGHWYQFKDVTTTIKTSNGYYVWPGPVPVWRIDATGETVIYFSSDVKDASAHNSPQLWQIVQDAILQIIAFLGDHPEIAAGMIIAAGLTILTVWLINTGTGAILTLGSNTGSLVLALGILAVVGLGIYALFFTKRGRKAGSKTYQLGRRAYRRVRRRR